MAEPPGHDLRFFQANERTLLAWVRTALGCLAIGFMVARGRMLLQAAGAPVGEGPASTIGAVAGPVLAFLGPVVLVLGLVRYRAAYRALLRNEATSLETGSVELLVVALLLVSIAGALYVAIGG